MPRSAEKMHRLGPACTERGRPPAGYFTKRLAEDGLRRTLDEARRGTPPGMVGIFPNRPEPRERETPLCGAYRVGRGGLEPPTLGLRVPPDVRKRTADSGNVLQTSTF